MGLLRKRNRTVCGINVTLLNVYAVFSHRGRNYKWCKLGHLEDVTMADNPIRIGTFKTPDLAVAFVAGLWTGSDAWIKNSPAVDATVRGKNPSVDPSPVSQGTV